MKKQVSKIDKFSRRVHVSGFPSYLKTILQDHYLLIDRRIMSIKALELFVKYGLGMENELLGPLHKKLDVAKTQNETRKEQERNDIAKDIEIIKQMVSVKLCACYRYIHYLIFSFLYTM